MLLLTDSHVGSMIPKTRVNFHDEHFLHHDEAHRQHIANGEEISQHDMTTNDLIGGIIIKKFLGQGSFGAAFTCEFSNPHRGGLISSYVIKLPINLLSIIHDYETQLQNQGLKEIIEFIDNYFSRDSLDIRQEAYRHAQAESIRNFRLETQNAEAILQPPIYALRRVLHARQANPTPRGDVNHFEAGKRLEKITRDEYVQLIHAMQTLRQHPGHAHWHPILHADLDIPCILSAQADGNLNQLVKHMADHNHKEMVFQSQLPQIWLTIAYQMGIAIEYMSDYSEKVHSDLKPENVLFRFEEEAGGNRKLHLWISDYGICKDQGPIPSGNFLRFAGTSCFTPFIEDHAEWSIDPKPPYVAITIYQYMMSLITCLVYEEYSVPTFVIPGQYPDRRGVIFHPEGDARRNILALHCDEATHQAVWQNFIHLIYFTNPHYLVPLFQAFMQNIRNLPSPSSYNFVMSFAEYQYVMHGVHQPEDIMTDILIPGDIPMNVSGVQRYSFANAHDPVFNIGSKSRMHNGLIGDSMRD